MGRAVRQPRGRHADGIGGAMNAAEMLEAGDAQGLVAPPGVSARLAAP